MDKKLHYLKLPSLSKHTFHFPFSPKPPHLSHKNDPFYNLKQGKTSKIKPTIPSGLGIPKLPSPKSFSNSPRASYLSKNILNFGLSNSRSNPELSLFLKPRLIKLKQMESFIIKGIELGMLLMAGISTFTCMARTDFNLPFSLLCYYLMRQCAHRSEDLEELSRKLLMLNMALGLLELIYLITMHSIWNSEIENSPDSWDNREGLHSFVMVLSWVNWVLRVVTILAFFYVLKDSISEKGLIPQEYDMRDIRSS